MADKEVSFTIRAKDAASAALKQIESSADKVTQKLFSFKDILGGIVGVAGAFSLGAVIKDIVDLGIASDATFRTIANNLPTFTEGIGALRDGVSELAVSSGRSLESMQQAAVAISKLGVSSASDLQAQLTAATALSDATGASLDTSVQVLQQLRREFGLTGDQALDTAAKLAEATKGKASIDDLLTAFQRATPIFQEFGLSADEGIRAIVALIQKGATARSVGTDLGQIADKAGFDKLASQAQIATGYMDDFNRAIENTRDGADRSAQSIKTQLTVAIEGIFKNVGGPEFLKGFADLLTTISHLSFTGILQLGQGIGGITNAVIEANTKGGFQFGGSGQFGGTGASGTFGAPSGGSGATGAAGAAKNPLSGITTKADVAAQAKAVADGVENIRRVLQALREETKNSDEAFKALGDALAHLSGDVLAQFDQSVDDTTNAIKKQIETGDPARVAELTARLNDLQGAYAAIRPSVQAVSDAQQASLQVQSAVAKGNLDVEGGLSDLSGLLDVYKQKEAESLDPTEAENYRKAVDLISQAMDNLGNKIPKGLPKKEDVSLLKEIAAGWDTVGRSIVAAAQALGGLDDKSAAALQNVVSLGDGIAKALTGNVVGGVAEGVTALAGLVTSLFHHAPSAAELQQQKDTQDNTKALDNLRAAIQTGRGASVTGGLTQGVAGLALTGVTNNLGGAFLGNTEQNIVAMQEAAKALGITLDGSKASLEALKGALEAVMPELKREADEAAETQRANLTLGIESAEAFTLAQKQQLQRDQLAEQQREELQAAQDKRDDDAAAGLDTTLDDEALAQIKVKDAAEQAALAVEQFADAIGAVNDSVSTANDILGISGPGAISNFAAGYNAQNQKFGSSFAIDLSPFDLGTIQGDDSAISYLQGLYQGLDPSDPNYGTYVGEIKSLVDQIRSEESSLQSAVGAAGVAPSAGIDTGIPSTGISPTGSVVTGTVTGISDAQANGVLGYLNSIDTTLTAYLPKISDALSLGSSLGARSFDFGSISSVGSMTNTFNFYVEGQSFESFIATLNVPQVSAALDRALGQRLSQARITVGAQKR